MKFVCSICGYVYEGEAAPAECPVCHACLLYTSSSFSFPSIINGLLIAGQIPSAVLQDTGLRQNHRNSALSV